MPSNNKDCGVMALHPQWVKSLGVTYSSTIMGKFTTMNLQFMVNISEAL